jgi:hypothetical protein
MKKRRGNDAPWKAGKTQKIKASFPPFPPGLDPDFVRTHISTAPPAGLYQQERTKNEAKTRFQLTDPGHFKHHKGASVASLRS